MSELVLEANDDSFDETVLQSDVPVLVDFWAEWCQPCKMQTPILEEVAPGYDGKLKIVKVNVEDSQATAQKYAIRSIPNLIIFKAGNVEAVHPGLANKAELTAFIDSNI